jgi:YbbR domain-containing protein
MRRLARFLVRNWPLKIGAVGLAIILYGGMVFLQSTTVWPGSVAITPVNYPADSTIVDNLPTVGDIRYIAPPDVPITINTFSATIDLAGSKAGEGEQLLNVNLVAVDQRIQIIDYQPKQIRVHLDPIITNTVPVVVSEGTYPTDLQPGTPVTSVSTVQVRGAARYVRTVAYAKAAVRVDASGLDVNQDVDLVAADASGNTVNNVTVTPHSVHVSIRVGSQIRTQTVPVHASIVNSPASGYYVTSVDVSPLVVEVQGQADALAQVKGTANTKPISVAGATGDVSASVDLDLPAGVTLTSPTKVNVVVHLSSPDSTRSVPIGLIIQGAKSGLFYTLSTNNAMVTIGGATAALNAFDTSSLVGVVSVGSLGPGTTTVAIAVTLPAGIKLVGISPPQVIVTVTTPATPSPSPPASAAP